MALNSGDSYSSCSFARFQRRPPQRSRVQFQAAPHGQGGGSSRVHQVADSIPPCAGRRWPMYRLPPCTPCGTRRRCHVSPAPHRTRCHGIATMPSGRGLRPSGPRCSVLLNQRFDGVSLQAVLPRRYHPRIQRAVGLGTGGHGFLLDGIVGRQRFAELTICKSMGLSAAAVATSLSFDADAALSCRVMSADRASS